MQMDHENRGHRSSEAEQTIAKAVTLACVVRVLSVLRALVSGTHSNPRPDVALAHDGLPLRQCGGASCFVDVTADEMTFVVEMVVDRGMDRAEFL